MAERDINVSELADMTGLHKNTIVAIRTGDTTRPCTETRYAIARALNVKVNDIWTNA
ncbi:helix-turn-helix transcriptional regulator (plasmid) [Alicyclobacillus curvatus]|nr:helix-turn-helix transcriptional regulator [Alicyclobacillus curvatus]